jgi:hypothetical protein
MKKRKKTSKKKCVAPLEPPLDANGRTDKNGHFSICGATRADNKIRRAAGDALRYTRTLLPILKNSLRFKLIEALSLYQLPSQTSLNLK